VIRWGSAAPRPFTRSPRGKHGAWRFVASGQVPSLTAAGPRATSTVQVIQFMPRLATHHWWERRMNGVLPGHGGHVGQAARMPAAGQAPDSRAPRPGSGVIRRSGGIMRRAGLGHVTGPRRRRWMADGGRWQGDTGADGCGVVASANGPDGVPARTGPATGRERRPTGTPARREGQPTWETGPAAWRRAEP